MPIDANETPLFALNAVALDTETTGLDPAYARIMEIGALAWPEQADKTESFETFVAIPDGVPGRATAVTGINDSMLVGAPSYPVAFRQLQEFIGDRVLIGHSFGFDISMFSAENARIGLDAWQPVSLDTRFLGQIALPRMPDYSIETLVEILNIRIIERHRALADARMTAQIFSALIPLLREHNIRTLGEAISACKRFEERADYPKVWSPLAPANNLQESDSAIAPLDAFLFTHDVASIMTESPQFVSPATSLGEAAAQMARAKAGSLLVGEPADVAGMLGIVTERDVLRAVGTDAAAGLRQPVGSIASRPLQSVPYSAFMYRAIGRMTRLGIRHLGVTNEIGTIVGVISARDLLKSRLSAPIALADGIDTAVNEVEMGRVWAQLPSAARSMLANRMDGREVAAVVGREVAALTRRAAVLAEQRLRAEGQGDPPCAYAVVVLGSAGRGESLLAFDQDNAIIFEHGEEGGSEDSWFARLGAYMCDTLHAVGVPYCEGGVMARNPAWRGSIATWEKRTAGWIGKSRPQDLLAVDITYDFRPVHGDLPMAEALWRRMWKAADGQFAFLKLLGESGAPSASPFGFFGKLQTQNGRIDLKKYGLKHVVTAARIFALRHQVLKRATIDRLCGVIETGKGPASDIEGLIDAQRIFLTLIVRQQLRDMAAGRKAGNSVVVADLAAQEQTQLQKALRHMTIVDQIVRDQLTA